MVNLAKCCICGKEAELHLHGLWWCKNHSEYLSKKSKSRQKEEFTKRNEKISTSLNLELRWM
ncbi:hypothetical protein AKJ49_00175 [candidate division MSBL1 archaeon SCGC-AAA382A03]|uniref:Uncharacterized protein n=1 Tax=candidate division MSBL1 archaeon SCGC-AAA382A03 TaxID=1698278 RepID=A0A133VH06_9EURY|nr:hypothetical protein AKJ49_00175 [candidate division MSBL1 archaeon SCGC-AAA382A03]